MKTIEKTKPHPDHLRKGLCAQGWHQKGIGKAIACPKGEAAVLVLPTTAD